MEMVLMDGQKNILNHNLCLLRYAKVQHVLNLWTHHWLMDGILFCFKFPDNI